MAKVVKNKVETLTVVEEVDVEEMPVEQKIEKTINQELQKANLTEAIIANLKEKYLLMSIKGQEDKETYLEVVEARKDCKKWRILAEKVCKKGREAAVIEQKLWLAKEKDVAGRIGEVETYLETQETAYEVERDRIKAENKARQEANYTNRTLALVKMGAEFNGTAFVLGDIEYSASLIRETDTDIYEGTILPKYREIFDKNEVIRLESERIKQEQEAEMQRQRDELARQQQELADQQRKLRDQQDEADRIQKEKDEEAAKIAREAREAEQRNRLDQLFALGLKADFGDNHYKGYDCFVPFLDIQCHSKEQWDELIAEITPHIEKKKADAAQKEADRIETEKQAAIDKALADQKERQRLEEKRKEDDRIAEEQRKALELEKAGDAAQWANFIGQIKTLTFPTAKSGQYRKMIAITREKLEEIQALKP